MPLARLNSRTRSNSRSPAPPSGLPPSQRFHPPSHYAAAAGIAYNSSRPAAPEGSSTSTITTTNAAFNTSRSNLPDKRSSSIPISYPSQCESTSDVSLFEFDHAVQSRSSDVQHDSATYSQLRDRRSSHLGDLPLLEAHLLPSLRDTIRRMTRPPPSLFSKPPPAPSSTSSMTSISKSSRSVLSSTPPQSRVNSPSESIPADSFELQTPKPVSRPSSRSANSTPTRAESSAPKAKLKPKPKPILKSALRAPTPKLTTTTDRPHPSPGQSSRSVKSLISAGEHMRTPTHIPVPAMSSDVQRGEISQNARSGNRPPRVRSRTDPGTGISGSSNLKSPTSVSVIQPKTSSSSKSSTFASGLPRYRRPDDDSEVEYRYPPERKLVVTNAGVVSSSSESETEVEAKTPDDRTRFSSLGSADPYYSHEAHSDNPHHQRWEGSRLGLGLANMDRRTEEWFLPRHNARMEDTYADSNGSNIYDTGWAGSQSRPASRTDGAIQRKRQDALLGIVDGLGHGLGLGSEKLDVHEWERPDSYYDGEQGLAIGGSGEFSDTGDQIAYQEVHYDGHGFESRRYDREDRGSWTNERGARGERTTNEDDHRHTMPRVVITAEEDGLWNKQVPRHLMQQHSANPYPNTPPVDVDSARVGRSYQQDHMRNGDSNRPGAFVEKPRMSPSRSPSLQQDTDSSTPTNSRRHSEYRDPTLSELNSLSKTHQVDYISRRRLRQDDPPHESVDIRSKSTAEPIDREKILTRTARKTLNSRAGCEDWDVKRSESFDNYTSDAASLAESSYAAAVRERKAFGIPPSVSDVSGVEHEKQDQDETSIPHADSTLSSVGGVWQEGCETLSTGAEALFRKLSTGHDRRPRSDDIYRDEPRRIYRTSSVESYSSSTPSQRSSISSVYDDPDPDNVMEYQCPTAGLSEVRSWRSTLDPARYRSLLDAYGEQEIHRQEMIWILTETENDLVNRLHTIVRLFITPLRMQNSKVWIAGVPIHVARLFDWLEDIVNLHSQILSVLQGVRSEQNPMVETVAELIRGFVPRLEVYQPYLVKLEEVTEMIKRSMASTNEEDSDFGEFVKIQEGGGQCDGWNLERLLVEPVNRLAKYPGQFQRLLDKTPKTHADYLSTFSLLHSTNMVIRVLGEVKSREDEYDLVKHISARIQGLPSSVPLARRERRLLAQGLLCRVQPHTSTLPAPRTSPSLSSCDAGHGGSSDRNSRLFDAINGWGAHRGRTGSLKSTESAATSFRSYESGFSSPSANERDQGESMFFLNSQPTQRKTDGVSSSSAAESSDSALLQVFIFTDLIVFASPLVKKRKGRDWKLLDDIGVSRVLGVSEHSQCLNDQSSILCLDLLPMDVQDLESSVILDHTPVSSVYLSIPKVLPNDASENPSMALDEWRTAFQQCFKFTLRSLSFPSHSGKYLVHGPNVDLEQDTRQSVMSILASGLPLPKSPSIQIKEISRGEAASTREQEREERGWWSLRFQQILREMQRQDLPSIYHDSVLPCSSPWTQNARTLVDTSHLKPYLPIPY